MLFIISELGDRYLKLWKKDCMGNCFHCSLLNLLLHFPHIARKEKKGEEKKKDSQGTSLQRWIQEKVELLDSEQQRYIY